MQELRRALQGIKQGERSVSLILMVTYALALFGLYLLKPARDSIFLSHQASTDLPLAFIVTAALAIPISLIYGRASRTWGLRTMLVSAFAFVLLGLIAWRLILVSPTAPGSYLFYAFTGIAGSLVASQFWLLGNALCDAQQAKRLFPLLSLGGISGAALGGWAASWLSGRPGIDALDLIVLCALVWMVALGLSLLALNRQQLQLEPRRRRVRTEDQKSHLLYRDIVGSRHLLLIIGIISLSVLVSTFIDFQFKTLVAAAHPESSDLLAYLGSFYAWMNLASLGLQLVLTSRLLRGVGVGGTLLVLPILLTLGSVALLIVPGLVTVSILRGSEMGLKYSLDKTSRELLYLPLPLGLKRRVKVFIDTFVERGSRGLAGVLLLITTSVLHLSMRGTTIITMVLLLAWIGVALAMRREYIRAFRQAVARREVDRDDLHQALNDPAAVATLETSLASTSSREVAYALSLLANVEASSVPAPVADLLNHIEPSVRQRALALLMDSGGSELLPRVTPLLDDQEPETGRLAAAFIHRHGGEPGLVRALTSSLSARSSVLLYLSRLTTGEEIPRLVASDDLPDMLATTPEWPSHHRVAVAEYLGRIWDGDVAGLLDLLGEFPIELMGSALVGLGRQVDRSRLEPLARLLDQREMRPWARRAIAPYGPVAVPTLVQVATRPGVIRPTCRAALLALGRLPYQRTVDALMKPLVQGGAMFRDDLIPVLLRLRERRNSLKFPRGAVEKAMRLEVDEARQLMKLGVLLGPVQDNPWDNMLHGSVNVARRKRWERIFQLMALRHDVRDIMGAWMRFTDDDRRRRADAEEFLENLLAPRLKLMLRGLLTVDPSWQKPDREQSLRGLLAMEDPWLRSCAISTIDLQDQPKFRDDLEQIRGEDSFLVSETAGMVLDAPRRSGTMLTTIEKAILLEKVDFFSAVAGEQMAGIAMIAEEMALGDGEVVYQAGEPSDAMYLVVDGFISLKRGDEEIARSEGGEAFGAWALFDMEPRIVSAVADGACRLLRIDREDFADLMAEDVHVAQSLIKSITSRLRQLAARVS